MIRNTKIGGTDFDMPTARIRPSDLNDTFDAVVDVLEGSMVQSAQLAYEQVKSDSSNWTNTDYLGADIFTDSNGAKNTVSGDSTANYDSDDDAFVLDFTDEAPDDTTHDPDNFNNPENAFDGDDGTSASKSKTGTNETVTGALGKTFSNKYYKFVRIKASASYYCRDGGNTSAYIKLQTYDGSDWNDEATLESQTYNSPDGTKSGTITYDGTYDLDKEVQGIRIDLRGQVDQYSNESDKTTTIRLHSLEYGNTTDTELIVNPLNDKVPKSILVYAEKDIPDDTDITIDVSQDGGSNWDITDKELNSYIDTSSFTGSDLALKFNLSTTDTSKTPKIYGYSVVLTDS